MAALVPLLAFSLNKSEHWTQDLVRGSKHWEERQEEETAAFPEEDMAEWEREPGSRMARQRRGRPSVKLQRLRARGRGRYSLSSCVVSPGARDRCACPGADLHQGGGERALKPYPCLPVQRALKLPLSSKIHFQNPHNPWRAPATQYPMPSGTVPQPNSVTSLALTLPQPTHTSLPAQARLPARTLPRRPVKSTLSILGCRQDTFLCPDLYKTMSQGHRSGLHGK